ncbi:phenylalanyl-tRNA synthetase alpha chain [Nematocida major]|uniref:phenylalanyl-tRNA synthetase alpha chain n=1 Tax=Nematocida major TaxID=1912982 RepID=UPI002007CA4E|nr:phenylalanyl-tRNA synthetase alpha chain [Nematocida major]KAH9386805.1 phenylalanyl-tRNA synthetase alpha chain [Nematocida major]
MGIEDIERALLGALESAETVCTVDIEGDYTSVIGAVKRLESFNKVCSTPVQHDDVYPTEEGAEVLKYGSAEYIVYLAVETPLSNEQIESALSQKDQFKGQSPKEIADFVKKGKNNGLKAKILRMCENKVCRGVDSATDATRDLMGSLKALKKEEVSELKKRKLVTHKKITHYTLTKGSAYGVNAASVSDITADMLASMEGLSLKKYNFNIITAPSKYAGALHPLSLEREKVKSIFLQMGFQEMDAGKYVESSFWNFDALFQPQRHPARNEQDTFFLADPAECADPEPAYLERVRTVHTVGGYGSAGYNAPWSVEESRKNVLRTHTTAVTTRLLYKLAQEMQASGSESANYSRKYFSIDRVFRNESLDATHLAEFHQVEGIIMGKGLTISHLMGYMEEFFKKLGISRIKYKPAYNPYTEPSMEVFGYHEEMKRWMEIGNSGIFRPEMLLPMGYPEDVRVIGWGISLERPVMIGRKINNIRDLVGHKVDMSFIRNGLAG